MNELACHTERLVIYTSQGTIKVDKKTTKHDNLVEISTNKSGFQGTTTY